MKLILTRPKHLQVDDKPCKTKLNEHTAQVKVRHIALCGSDFGLYDGTCGEPSFYPIILGHEWVGEIVAISTQSVCLMGTIGGTGAFQKAIAFIHEHSKPVANMVTKRISCEIVHISNALQSSCKNFLKLIIDF